MRYILLFAALLFIGCDRPECKNTNPVFDKYAVDSREYNAELVKEIEKHGKNKVAYWIHNNSYIKAGNKEYMLVWVQGDDLCANAMLDITGTKKLGNYQKVNGQSYGGAELKGLNYDIATDSSGYRFVFNDVDWIAD